MSGDELAREMQQCYDILDDGSDSTLFTLIHQLKEHAESLAARLAHALDLLNDDDFIRTLYDYRARGHLSYAGQLGEHAGTLDKDIRWAARASRAGTGERT